jgi:hypothetical protein
MHTTYRTLPLRLIFAGTIGLTRCLTLPTTLTPTTHTEIESRVADEEPISGHPSSAAVDLMILR